MPFVPDSPGGSFVPDAPPPAPAPPPPPQNLGDQAKNVGSGLANAAERGVGGSLINAITFIPDVATQIANVAGGAVDKVLGIKEPDIDLPSSFWHGKMDKVTKPPTSTVGKIAEGATTALGAGALSGVATGVKATEQAVARGLRTAEKIPPLTRITTKSAERAMSAGYDLTPAYVGGSVGKAVQSAVGKAAAHRAASVANEPITDGLAKLSLGLAKSHELSPENLDKLEEEAYSGYEHARALGTLPDDDQFRDAVREAGKRFRFAGNKYTFEGIQDIKSPYLDSTEMDSNQLVDDVRALRASSRANLSGLSRPQDRAVGYVQRQIADALEERLDRAAKAAGQPDLLKNLRASRVQIAKINTVRDVLGPGGHIRAADLARIDEAQPGMLTDGLKLIADTAKNFEKDVQLVSAKGEEGAFSVVDYLLGGTGVLTGHPAVSGLSLARPIAKAALLSEGVQKNMLRNIGERSKPPSKLAKSVRNATGKVAGAAGRGALISGSEALAGNQDFGDQSP